MGELFPPAIYLYSQREHMFRGKDTTWGPASSYLTLAGCLTELRSQHHGDVTVTDCVTSLNRVAKQLGSHVGVTKLVKKVIVLPMCMYCIAYVYVSPY